MSLQARRELLNSLRPRYREASKIQKIKILDEFIQVTQYGRKHAIALLNKDAQETQRPKGTGRKRKYDEQIKKVLIQVWRAANEICSKRLIPFLPEFLEALERAGHLKLTEEIRAKLLTMSPSTADQLLAPSDVSREENRQLVLELCSRDKFRSGLFQTGTMLNPDFSKRTWWRIAVLTPAADF